MLKAARAAKRGCELAPASPPEGLEIATVAGVAPVVCIAEDAFKPAGLCLWRETHAPTGKW